MGRYVRTGGRRAQGGGGTVQMEEFTKAGIVTNTSNNNVSELELGNTKYKNVLYDSVGLITSYTENFGQSDEDFRIEYDGQFQIKKIIKGEHTGPTASVSFASTTSTEGVAFACTVTGGNGLSDSAVLYWDVSNDYQFEITTGQVTLSSGTGNFDVTPKDDSIYELRYPPKFRLRIYTDAARMERIGESVDIPINDPGTGGGGGGTGEGSQSDPITNFTSFKAGKTAADDGKYWFQLSSGSNTAFETWVTFRDNGWVKVAQMNNNTDVMSGTSAINAGGSWIDSEINTNQPGKLNSQDINELKHKAFLLRVTGSPNDAFLNNRAGSMIFEYINSETLPTWGNSQDPTGTYDLKLDHDNSGTGMEIMRYNYESRTLCANDGNHPGNGSYWVSDHNYNGSWQNQIWGSSGAPICWTISNNRIHTNQHWMGGPAGSSGSNQQWGNNSSNAVAIFLQPQ